MDESSRLARIIQTCYGDIVHKATSSVTCSHMLGTEFKIRRDRLLRFLHHWPALICFVELVATVFSLEAI